MTGQTTLNVGSNCPLSGLNDVIDQAEVQARAQKFTAEFDLEAPPAFFNDAAGETLEENITGWCHAEGVSIDWLLFGDAWGAIAHLRKSRLRNSQVRDDLRRLDKAEVTAVTAALGLSVEGGFDAKDTIAACELAIKEYRSKVATP